MKFCVSSFAGGLLLTDGEDVVHPKDKDDPVHNKVLPGITLITNYNLQTYVPIPVAGENPVREIRSRADLEVDAVWHQERAPNSGSWTPMAAGTAACSSAVNSSSGGNIDTLTVDEGKTGIFDPTGR
ncbi:MAG: hypothetical protein LBP42_06050 [Treponema sp.]|nr:hypothetical protein [Treponema sp.]